METDCLRVIGLMAVYNEEDILEQTISYTLSQGLELIVLDNGSSDRSHEIAMAYQAHGVLCVRRVVTETYQWAFLLDTMSEWAREFGADWAVLIDADTFLESPYSGLSLREAIQQEARAGYNVIRFNNFEFWPTQVDPADEPDIRRRITYYTFNDDHQEKAWTHIPGVNISRAGGHQVLFPEEVKKAVSPRRFVMRHYKVRSYQHGLKKVFKERLPRFLGEPQGWHIQYDWMTYSKECFVRDPIRLTQYKEDRHWNLSPTLGRDGQTEYDKHGETT